MNSYVQFIPFSSTNTFVNQNVYLAEEMRHKITFLFALGLMFTQTAWSQNESDRTYAYPDSIIKPKLYKAVGIEVGSYIVGLSFLKYIWYKDHDRVPFHFYDDSKGYLQMDKAGHAFSAYRQSYAGYYALRRAGLNKNKSLLYGGSLGFIFQTPIEIFDGLYEGWGFSWSDMAANTFGSALFIGQEMAFDLQVVLMKFSYVPSRYPDYHNHLGETQVERFFLDYNAHTYWLSGNLRKITGIQKIPNWLNIAYGYSANGMIYEFDNPTFYKGRPFPKLERYRQHFLSLDIDFSRIQTKRKFLKTIFRTINLVKLPFPAIELNRVRGVRFRPLYF